MTRINLHPPNGTGHSVIGKSGQKGRLHSMRA